MSQALPGGHYCATHQGNHSHYDESNCELCRAQRERDEARAKVERLRKVLHRLACLGNGDQYGTSFGNDIAREVLAATEAKP